MKNMHECYWVASILRNGRGTYVSDNTVDTWRNSLLRGLHRWGPLSSALYTAETKIILSLDTAARDVPLEAQITSHSSHQVSVLHQRFAGLQSYSRSPLRTGLVHWFHPAALSADHAYLTTDDET
ncbi:hypothetical protein NDU88_007414 [Pleurodeles waltl]|uniref:Uncharacterized protein n=1 Tax=Pleurodeles waltl TaxID=8319 RepID=A0AAV7PTI7_PLEWA|nr:hypothetical protein NDU88_007414 [Pleurodeles waltl]